MKTFLKIGVVASFVLSSIVPAFAPAEAYVSAHGYLRSNGTYVKPYVRSNPNGLKYDNYGYKPSQGLYNSTYGTRGSYWDTPTSITDPYYYTGKSLYQYGSVGSSLGSNYSGLNFLSELYVHAVLRAALSANDVVWEQPRVIEKLLS